MSRYARKVDENQGHIVEAFRAEGAKVEPRLSRIGGGVLDLLCGLNGYFFVVEVKMPGEQLTEAEREWISEWAGFPTFVVKTAIEAKAVAQHIGRLPPLRIP